MQFLIYPHPELSPSSHPDLSQFNSGIKKALIVVITIVVSPNFQQLSQFIIGASRETLWHATSGETSYAKMIPSRLALPFHPLSRNKHISNSSQSSPNNYLMGFQQELFHDICRAPSQQRSQAIRLVPSTSPCFDGCTVCPTTNLPTRQTADVRRRWSWRRRPWGSRPGHRCPVANVWVCMHICVCVLCNTNKWREMHANRLWQVCRNVRIAWFKCLVLLSPFVPVVSQS